MSSFARTFGPARSCFRAVFTVAASLPILAGTSLAGAQTAHYLATQNTVATGTNSSGVPLAAVRDTAGNTYDLAADGSIYKLPAGCLDDSAACAGTAIVPATSGNVDLAVDASGAVYVVNSTAMTVTKYTAAAGAYTGVVAITLPETPYGIAIDPASGNLYLSRASGIYLQNPGSPATQLISNPFATYRVIRPDAHGNLIASAVNSGAQQGLQKIPFSGSASQLVGFAAGSFSAIGIDSLGNSYASFVPSSGASTVYQVPVGCAATTCAFALPGTTTPAAIVADPNTGVYVYDALSASNRIVDYSILTATDLGTLPVATLSAAQPLVFFGFDSTGTPGAPQAVTQGTPALDFTIAGAGTTCAGSASVAQGSVCSVQPGFAPRGIGVRTGAVELIDSSSNVIATAPLKGIGTASQAAFFPGAAGVVANVPNGIQAMGGDAAGNLYLEDSANNATFKYTLSGGSYTATPLGEAGLNNVSDFAVDGAGNVFYTDDGSNQIVKQTLSNGAYTRSVLPIASLSAPIGIAIDADGDLYIADSSHVVKETLASGVYTETTIATGLNVGFGLALDSNRNVYVADYLNLRILKLTLSGGSYIQTVIDGHIIYPKNLVVDGGGNLYVANYASGIVKYAPGSAGYTKTTLRPNGSYAYLTGLALNASGDLFYPDQSNNIVKQDLLTPPSLSFPTTAGRDTSAPLTVTLENTGNLSLNFAAPSSGTNPSVSTPFIISNSSTCPQLSTGSSAASLQPGASCTENVSFAPTTFSGASTGSLVITDDSQNTAGATQTISLSGTAKAQTFASFSISGISNITAGVPASATIQALDSTGVADPSYSGTVTLTSSDPQATFSSTSIAVTNGAGNFIVTFKTAGTVQLHAQDTSREVSSSIPSHVAPGPAVALVLLPPTQTIPVGTSFYEGVRATDAYGNPISGLPVQIAMSPQAGVAGATVQSSTVTSGDGAQFTANNTLGSYTISFSSSSLTASLVVTNRAPDSFLVTVLTDPINGGDQTKCLNQTAGGYSTGATVNTNCSLSDAVAAANRTIGANISFAPGLATTAAPATISLVNSLAIFAQMTIAGPGSAALILDGTSNGGDILDVENDNVQLSGISFKNPNSTALLNDGYANLLLTDLTFTGTAVTTSGVFFENDGTANLRNSAFVNATPGATAPAVLNNTDTLTISGLTVSGNSTAQDLVQSNGAITITGSTFSGNTATSGYMLDVSSGTAIVANTTFTANTGATGEVIAASGSLLLRNTTIYGNTHTGATGAGPVAVTSSGSGNGSITVTNSIIAGENGVAAAGSCTGCTDAGNNLIGVDPMLMALANNSPATQIPALQTMLPLLGSPAICAGVLATETLDERGYPRPTLSAANSCYDIGAVQTSYTLAFTQQPTDTVLNTPITPAPAAQLTEHALQVAGAPIVITASSGTLTDTATQSTSTTGIATFSNLSLATAGSYALTATSGAYAVTSNSFNVTAAKTTPVVTFAAPADIPYGTALTGTQLAATATVPGTFVYTPAAGAILNAGTQTLSVQFTPTSTANYVTPPAATVSITVTPATTSTTLTSSSNPSIGGAPVTFTATVAAAGPVPTGSVSFSDGATVLGTALLTNGVATYQSSALSITSHTITATYVTNGNDATSSGTVSQVVNSSIPFTLSGSGTGAIALTVTRGNSVTTTFVLTPSALFSGVVNLSCTGLPVGASCVFSSTPVNITAGMGPQTISLRINSSTLNAGLSPAAANSAMAPQFAMLFWMPALLLAGLGARSRKRTGHNRLFLLGLALLCFAGMGALTGCAGPNTTTAASGVYSVNALAVGGNATQTLPITLTVQ